MKNIKMVVFDMDGTLLDQNSQISPRTFQVLDQLLKKGILVTFASGRNHASLSKFALEIDLKKYGGWLIGVNGQQIAKPANGFSQVLKNLSPRLNKKALKYAIEKDLEYISVLDKELYAYLSPRIMAKKKAYIKEHNLSEEAYTGGVFGPINPQRNYPTINYLNSLDDLPDISCNKVVFTEEPEVIQPLREEIDELFQGEIDFAFTSPRWYEGMPAGINKGAALKLIAEKEGIKLDEIIAFGDGENDIPMLQVAGTGVAMANAMDTVKAQADIIALSNQEDGVAVILEQILA